LFTGSVSFYLMALLRPANASRFKLVQATTRSITALVIAAGFRGPPRRAAITASHPP